MYFVELHKTKDLAYV
ncbi:unnamed protein product, partial [Allacma fusca]